MNGFWDLLIRPALEAAAAREIVEIGSEGGKHTRRLLDWCSQHGARLHVIEPVPGYDPAELAAAYPQAFVFHQATSLEILPKLGRIDAALIDGDHNWYTVHHELLELEKTHGGDFPLVLLHDMSWPFARRDMYYAPERIPVEYRQPYACGGVLPGQAELVPAAGLSPEIHKSIAEGGPRNGVRTAVEDFMAQSALPLRLDVLPVDFGLGVLASRTLLERRPALRELLDGVNSREFDQRLLAYGESRRIDDLMAAQRVLEHLGLVDAELRRHEVEVKRLREMLETAHAELRALRIQVQSTAKYLAWRVARPIWRSVRGWIGRA